jgi:hypothetical protein
MNCGRKEGRITESVEERSGPLEKPPLLLRIISEWHLLLRKIEEKRFRRK